MHQTLRWQDAQDGGRKGFIRWLCIAMLLFPPILAANWDFVRIQQQSDRLYGPATPGAKRRIAEWQAMIDSARDKPLQSQLNTVNQFFNRKVKFLDDSVVWRQKDYWATPMEFLRKGAGDCEDYALAKYFSLLELGVPAAAMRITYVKALELNQAHMVLTWYATPDATPLVLDNLIEVIKPASQRGDLLPIYSFNGEGVWLPKATGTQRVGDTKRLSRWQDVVAKMQAEGFNLKE